MSQDVKAAAAYYCGALTDTEQFMITIVDRRHFPFEHIYEAPEGIDVSSNIAIGAAIDAAKMALLVTLSDRSLADEAYLLGVSPSTPVMTAAGIGLPQGRTSAAVVGNWNELPVAANCTVLVTNFRTSIIVEASSAAHRRWCDGVANDGSHSSLAVDGACYDVNLQFDGNTISVMLIRRVAQVITVPHMSLADNPRASPAPTLAIIEDASGFSRILPLHSLVFVSKVMGGAGPVGGEMRLAFADRDKCDKLIKPILAMRHYPSTPVAVPSDARLNEPNTKLLAALLPLSLLLRMPAFDLYKAWEGDGCVADQDFGWSVHDEAREMLRWLTIYDAEKVPAPEDPAGYHSFGAAGAGCDLRPWFRLSTLHPATADSDIVGVSSVTPLIGGYGPTPTYPLRVCVPAAATDSFLIDNCFPARSRQRIPAVSYVNLRTGAVLCRSSQPLKGRSTATASDEELCRYMVNHYTTYNSGHRNASQGAPSTVAPGSPTAASFSPPPSIVNRVAPPSLTSLSTRHQDPSPPRAGGGTVTSVITTGPKTLAIVDCRPRSAAMANDTVGGGYERHDLGRVKFFGIDNIHAVTGSYNKLRQLLIAHSGMMGVVPPSNTITLNSGPSLVPYPRAPGPTCPLGVLHAGGLPHNVGSSSDFHRTFWAETAWMEHIHRVLTCALETAEYLERGESALVHCTDGWDRTSQTTALAMILLDPFYRTVRGFALLIEKEFAQFGHKFAERLGHMHPLDTAYTSTSGVKSSDTEGVTAPDASPKQQPSPVFLQFLDCLFQIVRQFPTSFEFTPNLLAYIAEQCTSCFYGTFLCNNAKERLFEGVTVGSQSIWTDVLIACDLERKGLCTPFLLEPTYDARRAMWFIQKRPKYDAPTGIPPATETPAVTTPDWSLAHSSSKGGCYEHTLNNCGIDFIRPNLSSKRLAFWEDLYLRQDPDRALLPGMRSTSTTSSFRVAVVLCGGVTQESAKSLLVALPPSVVMASPSVARCRTHVCAPNPRLSRGRNVIHAPPGEFGAAAPLYTAAVVDGGIGPDGGEDGGAMVSGPIVLQFTAVEVCGIAQTQAEKDPRVVPLTSGPLYCEEFLTWNATELDLMREHRRRDVRAIFRVHQLAHWHRNGGVKSTDQVASLRSMLGGDHPFLLTDSELFSLQSSNVRYLGPSDQLGAERQSTNVELASRQVKLKRCSQCSSSFGMFSKRYFCDSCGKKGQVCLPFCGKCVRSTADGRMLCNNCFAIEA